ncbi:thioredoxin-like protein [Pisolithus croceorrhizus]|nr:thioredoxin-like protein [Pisolithus croceorrhizus]KAI6122865.1 thioredoxin-like protein [Pisolithus croceorrhizus]KAI6169024.1 thioredoxin-like protein [Pisolithus thermaeus]
MKILLSLTRWGSPLSLLVAAFAIQATSAPVVATNVLTPDNFEETIANGVWFVEYFSPYCPHCRHFAPTWTEVVDHFEKQADPGVHLAQVNCALNGDLCSEKGVTGYPQMNLYRNGEFVDKFSKNREFDLLVDYLSKHAEPTGVAIPDVAAEEEVFSTVPPPEPTTAIEQPLHVQVPSVDPNPTGVVVELTTESFDSFLSQGPAFVKFFAPWCGHCKKLAPTWSQLARHMQHKLNIAEVNCDDQKPLCSSQGIPGYPTLLYYAHGVKTEYTGGRKYDQLVAFSEHASHPTMQIIEASQLDEVIRDKPVIYLLLHTPADKSIVDHMAKESQHLLGSPPIYLSSSQELFKQYDIPSDAPYAVLSLKDHDAGQPTSIFYPSPSQPDKDALRKWLFANRFPTSFELSREVFQDVMNAPHQPLVVIVSTPPSARDSVAEKLNDIGKKWRLKTNQSQREGGRRDIVFTWMDADQWGKWMKNMYAIKAVGEPEVVVADHGRLLYYNKDGSEQPIKLNFVSISSTLEAILQGTARPKHSENVFERAVQLLNWSVVQLGQSITAHPYVTVLLVLGSLASAFAAIMKLLRNDFQESHPDKRYAKSSRID